MKVKGYLKRAAMIGLSAVLSAGVLAGCGTQNSAGSQSNANESVKVYKVGVVQYADHPSLDNCREGFIQGLEAEGIVEGTNLEITSKSAQGDDALDTQIAQSFVNAKMDLVCGIATPSAMALYNACYEKNIPVIFNAVSDPVAANLAKSKTEAMPGITGVSDELPVTEQLKLIREIMPDAKKIGIIYTTSEANSVSTIETYKEQAGEYGFEIVERGISNAAEIPQAADVILGEVDCITNLTDNTVVDNLPVVLEKANAANIPVFGSEEEQVGNGCIASAGIDYIELGKIAGEMAAKVLKGEDIANMPYKTITESNVTVNEQVASKLGIVIPEELLAAANKK
ncbi:MAG: ABC transporter substrate-binding protein [Clostridiales bacterium]|nr:ABC transporter substrate-binding protein [Clostridiales bacterium]